MHTHSIGSIPASRKKGKKNSLGLFGLVFLMPGSGFDPRLAAKDPDLETILSLRKQRSEDGATSYQLTLTGSRSNSFTSSPTTPATGDSAAQIFERSGDEPSEGVSPDGSASLYSTLGVAPDVLSVHSRTLAVAAHARRCP